MKMTIIEGTMEELMKQLFPEQVARRERGECAICSKPNAKDGLRDELAKREFAISGLCQECQDKHFDPQGVPPTLKI